MSYIPVTIDTTLEISLGTVNAPKKMLNKVKWFNME